MSDSGYAESVLGPLLVAGLGFGFTVAPSMNTGTYGIAPQDAGVASATLNTGQQIGGSIGISLLNTIFASSVAGYLASHLTPATLVHGHPAPSLAGQALVHGYTTGFWWVAGHLRGRRTHLRHPAPPRPAQRPRQRVSRPADAAVPQTETAGAPH